jgi:hypothetical protein
VLAATGPAHAATTPVAGTLTVSVHGLPAHVSPGQTIQWTISFASDSADTADVIMFSLQLWNTAQGSNSQTHGIQVAWLDPGTGTWKPSDEVSNTGAWSLNVPLGSVDIPKHGSLNVQVRITMGAKAKTGTENLMTGGPFYELVNSAGQSVNAMLNSNDAYGSFVFGSSSAGEPAPDPTPKPSTPSRQTSSAPTPVHTKASTAPASASPTPAETVSPTLAPTTAEAAAAPSVTPVTDLASDTRPASSDDTAFIAAGAVILLAACSRLILTIRRSKR